MLEHGWVVSATDYPGLGTAGPHPYLVGASEASALIDAVRAARALPGSSASSRYALWGHSQGGQAALFAAQRSTQEAPELSLVGVAVAAPATDLETLVQDDADTDGGRNLTAMTLWSWSRLYGIVSDTLVDPRARDAIDALSHECIESAIDLLQRRVSQRPLRERFLVKRDFAQLEPWRTLMASNTPPPLPPGVPAFIAQGDADTLVRPEVTLAYARAACARGESIRYDTLAGEGHGFAGRDSADAAVDWMAARFDGLPPPSDCARLQAQDRLAKRN
jgi:acetyl esterase/lipase